MAAVTARRWWILLSTVLLALSACGGHSTKHRTTTAAAPAQAPSKPSVARSPDDWPTYHRDLARGGFDPAAAPAGRLARSWSTPVDGKVYAEPLVAGGLVIAATENNSVYGLEAGTGRVRWRAHLGSPVNRGDLPCGDTAPPGITR